MSTGSPIASRPCWRAASRRSTRRWRRRMPGSTTSTRSRASRCSPTPTPGTWVQTCPGSRVSSCPTSAASPATTTSAATSPPTTTAGSRCRRRPTPSRRPRRPDQPGLLERVGGTLCEARRRPLARVDGVVASGGLLVARPFVEHGVVVLDVDDRGDELGVDGTDGGVRVGGGFRREQTTNVTDDELVLQGEVAARTVTDCGDALVERGQVGVVRLVLAHPLE